MNVKELINTLSSIDPDLPVYVSSSDHDFDWMTLHKEFISVRSVSDMDNEAIEINALCLGDGYQ